MQRFSPKASSVLEKNFKGFYHLVGAEKTWCGGVDCATGAGDVCKCTEPCPCWWGVQWRVWSEGWCSPRISTRPTALHHCAWSLITRVPLWGPLGGPLCWWPCFHRWIAWGMCQEALDLERSNGEERTESKCRKDKDHDLRFGTGPPAEFRRVSMRCLALEWAATASSAMAASTGCTRNAVGSSAWKRTLTLDVHGAKELHAPWMADHSCVWSAMLHASETWPLTKLNLQRLQRNDRAMIRQICNVRPQDIVTTRSNELLVRLGIEDLDLILKERRLWWYGHVECSSGAINTTFDIQIDGKRGPGRPKMTWKQLTERDCREWKLSAINPHDRRTWRSGVRSAMRAASQLPGRGPTDVDVAPVPAR